MAGSYSTYLLANFSPTLYWHLGETTGTTATDSSGNGNDGTYNSGTSLGVAGAIANYSDKAVDLNGSTGLVSAPVYNPYTAGSSRTFEGWAWRDSSAAISALIGATAGNGTNSRPSLNIAAGNGNVTWLPNEGAAGVTWTAAWPGNDQWVYWALTYNDATGNAILYINGVSLGQLTSANLFPGTNTTMTFELGANRGGTGLNNFDGKMDEVAIYTNVQAASAIKVRFQIGTARDIQIREKPPLRVDLDVKTPTGRHYRWAGDEPKPTNVPQGMTYSDTMPGGFEQFGCTLPRKADVDYADLERLSTITIRGAGGAIAGQYRLEGAPRRSGDQLSISPAAVGWQAALEDNKSARMIYRDIDLSRWGGASSQRRLNLLATNYQTSDASVVPDETTGAPRVACEIQTAVWAVTDKPNVEGWYSGNEMVLSSIYWAYDKTSTIALPDANWIFEVYLVDNAEGNLGNAAGIVEAASGAGTLTTSGVDKKFAAVTLTYNAAGGVANRLYGLYFKNLAVYGTHGLTLRGTEPNAGFFASDVVTHAVQTWAPSLQVIPGSVQVSSFVIPHLIFTEATTAGEIIRQASRFDLPDWGVWDDKVFYWNERGAVGRKWRARVGPSELEETGATVDRLWESIMVQYQDVDGSARTVGPPGSGADTETSTLKDSDPANPANELGIVRRDLLQMGVSTSAGAIEVGRRFLTDSRQLDRSGRARAVGYIEDDRGVTHPYWKPRAGDQITFVDASDTSYRRIVKTDKDHDARTVSFDLDAPPEGLQALLERLGVVLIPLGINS